MTAEMRAEHDSIGSMLIPAKALYGVHTARALQNFNVTGVPISHFPELVNAMATGKMASTQAWAKSALKRCRLVRRSCRARSTR